MRDLPLSHTMRSAAMHGLRGHRHVSAISVATCPGWRRLITRRWERCAEAQHHKSGSISAPQTIRTLAGELN